MEVYLKACVENRMVHRETQSRQALFASLGGIEWAKAHLRISPGLRQGSYTLKTGRVVVTIEASAEVYKVIAEGRSGISYRKIEEKLQLVNGKWVIRSYQELHR